MLIRERSRPVPYEFNYNDARRKDPGFPAPVAEPRGYARGLRSIAEKCPRPSTGLVPKGFHPRESPATQMQGFAFVSRSDRFSTDARQSALDQMEKGPLDLLVVGGGITGAGVARDAALRGMRVALVEKGDFASGTSSRSSKIIHGGVRYLEYLQLGLVRESARERRILRRIAPHLVHPLPFLYPVFQGESLLKIRAGLKLFDALARSAPGERSSYLSPPETRKYLPGLREPLKGSVLYPEFITDDARFTLANIVSAADHGAWVSNYTRVESLLVAGNRVKGALVRDLETDRSMEIQARITVNATGPWAQDLVVASGLSMPRRMIPSKGIHILVPRTRLPIMAATFLRSSSGRRGLAMPRGPWVYIGTSDSEFSGNLDAPRADPSETEELLEMTRDCFPDAGLTMDDIRSTWAGIRPLVFEAGKTTRDTSRHDGLWISPPGLVTVSGGKLTTYRPMARRILSAVGRALGHGLPGSERTHQVPLAGCPGEELVSFRSRIRKELSGYGVDATTVERIEFLYGAEADVLLEYGSESMVGLEPLAEGVPALRGEVRLAIEHGMARTLIDIMDRRLALLLFADQGGMNGANEAAAIAAQSLSWSRKRQERELSSYAAFAKEHRP